MAAASIESSSPHTINKDSARLATNSSPMLSPSSDKRFWSTLRNRIDTILENQKPIDQAMSIPSNAGGSNRAKRMKEDSLLLLRGFDSVSTSLSQLSSNIESALQGARDLAKPPTLSEIVHSTMENAKNNQKEKEKDEQGEGEKVKAEEGNNRGFKRKLDSQESPEENEESLKELGKLKKAKNIAISMANKAASLARELKSMKSDLHFMQERCVFLEEENRRLRDGFAKGIRPEEDDLMRLQMEALLAEKSRLANENANLTRENQCLSQLVEYHQLTSQQDVSEAYEREIRGMCLDFSSPPPTIPEEDNEEISGDDNDEEVPSTPRTVMHGSSASLDNEEEQ